MFKGILDHPQPNVTQTWDGPMTQQEVDAAVQYKIHIENIQTSQDHKIRRWIQTRLSFARIRWEKMQTKAPRTWEELTRPKIFLAVKVGEVTICKNNIAGVPGKLQDSNWAATEENHLSPGNLYRHGYTVIKYPQGLADRFGKQEAVFWDPSHVDLDLVKWMAKFPAWLDFEAIHPDGRR